MDESLKDILSGLSKDVDQETLLLYLQGKLTDEKKHEVEKKIMDSEFDSDALEGLQQFSSKADLSMMVDQLNLDLQKRILKKKKRREKLRLKNEPWLYFALLIIIILIIISYVVLQQLLKQGN